MGWSYSFKHEDDLQELAAVLIRGYFAKLTSLTVTAVARDHVSEYLWPSLMMNGNLLFLWA